MAKGRDPIIGNPGIAGAGIVGTPYIDDTGIVRIAQEEDPITTSTKEPVGTPESVSPEPVPLIDKDGTVFISTPGDGLERSGRGSGEAGQYDVYRRRATGSAARFDVATGPLGIQGLRQRDEDEEAFEGESFRVQTEPDPEVIARIKAMPSEEKAQRFATDPEFRKDLWNAAAVKLHEMTGATTLGEFEFIAGGVDVDARTARSALNNLAQKEVEKNVQAKKYLEDVVGEELQKLDFIEQEIRNFQKRYNYIEGEDQQAWFDSIEDVEEKRKYINMFEQYNSILNTPVPTDQGEVPLKDTPQWLQGKASQDILEQKEKEFQDIYRGSTLEQQEVLTKASIDRANSALRSAYEDIGSPAYYTAMAGAKIESFFARTAASLFGGLDLALGWIGGSDDERTLEEKDENLERSVLALTALGTPFTIGSIIGTGEGPRKFRDIARKLNIYANTIQGDRNTGSATRFQYDLGPELTAVVDETTNELIAVEDGQGFNIISTLSDEQIQAYQKQVLDDKEEVYSDFSMARLGSESLDTGLDMLPIVAGGMGGFNIGSRLALRATGKAALTKGMQYSISMGSTYASTFVNTLGRNYLAALEQGLDDREAAGLSIIQSNIESLATVLIGGMESRLVTALSGGQRAAVMKALKSYLTGKVDTSTVLGALGKAGVHMSRDMFMEIVEEVGAEYSQNIAAHQYGVGEAFTPTDAANVAYTTLAITPLFSIVGTVNTYRNARAGANQETQSQWRNKLNSVVMENFDVVEDLAPSIGAANGLTEAEVSERVEILRQAKRDSEALSVDIKPEVRDQYVSNVIEAETLKLQLPLIEDMTLQEVISNRIGKLERMNLSIAVMGELSPSRVAGLSESIARRADEMARSSNVDAVAAGRETVVLPSPYGGSYPETAPSGKKVVTTATIQEFGQSRTYYKDEDGNWFTPNGNPTPRRIALLDNEVDSDGNYISKPPEAEAITDDGFSESMGNFIAEEGVNILIESFSSDVTQRMDNNEDIPLSEIESATSTMYNLMETTENHERLTPDQKEKIKSKIGNIITKLEGYESATETETIPATTRKAARGVRIIGQQARGVPSKYDVTPERIGKSKGFVQSPDGRVLRGNYRIDESGDLVLDHDNGTEVLDRDSLEFKDTVKDDNGKVQGVIFRDNFTGNDFFVEGHEIGVDAAIKHIEQTQGLGFDPQFEEAYETITETPETTVTRYPRREAQQSTDTDVTQENIQEDGTIQTTPLNREEEAGRVRGGSTNVEATQRLEQDKSANQAEYTGDTDSIAAREEQVIEDYARESGVWLDESDIAEEAAEVLPSGAEARVYLSEDGTTVTKVIDYSVYSESLSEFFTDRVSLFNSLFPETAMEVQGFTRDEDGNFRVVVTQPFVEGTMLAPEGSTKIPADKQEALDKYMLETFGMERRGTTYFNDNYIIDDVHGGNVLESDGKFFFIDVVPALNTPEDGMGGVREYGTPQTDTMDIPVEATPTTTTDQSGVVSSINIAPLFSTHVSSPDQIDAVVSTEMYKRYKRFISDLAEHFGLRVVGTVDTLGAYQGKTEVSTIINIEGDFDSIVSFAAVIGALAPEVQDSTIAAKIVDPADKSRNADRYTITVNNPEAAVQAANDAGLAEDGFTLDGNNIIFLNIDEYTKNFDTKIDKFKQKLKEYGGEIQETTKDAVRSEFIDSSWRKTLIGDAKRAAVQQGERGQRVRNALEEAERRNNAYIEWKNRTKTWDEELGREVDSPELRRYKELRTKQLELGAEGKQLTDAERAEIKELEVYFVEPLSAFFAADRNRYEAAKQEVEAIANDIAELVADSFVSKFDVKKAPRAAIKSVRWYQANPNPLGDGSRTNIIVRTNEDADFLFEELRRRYNIEGISRVENEITELGYPKRLIEVITPTGKIAEIQVMTPEGYLAKDGLFWFPKDQKSFGKGHLDAVQRRVGYNIPDGVGHYFYEIERDTNVPNDLRQEAIRLSKQYYDLFLNPNSQVDVNQLHADLQAFRERVDNADKTNWDEGNDAKAPNTLAEFLSKPPQPVGALVVERVIGGESVYYTPNEQGTLTMISEVPEGAEIITDQEYQNRLQTRDVPLTPEQVDNVESIEKQAKAETNKPAVLDEIGKKAARMRQSELDNAVDNITRSFESSNMDATVHVHNSVEEFNDYMKSKGLDPAATDTTGRVIEPGRTLIYEKDNRSEVHLIAGEADAVTAYHEAGHVVFFNTFGHKPEVALSLAENISKALAKGTEADKALSNKVKRFAEKYKKGGDHLAAEEYFTELIGVLSANSRDISVNAITRMKNNLNRIVYNLIGYKPFRESSQAQDIIDFLNNISIGLRTGSDISGMLDGKNNPFDTFSKPARMPRNPQKIPGIKRSRLIDRLGVDDSRIVQTPVEEFADRLSVTISADRAVLGTVLNDLGVDYTMKGGFLYPLLHGHLWASTNAVVGNNIVNRVKESDGLLNIMLGSDDAVLGSYSLFDYTLKTLEAALQNNNISERGMMDVINKVTARKPIVNNNGGHIQFNSLNELSKWFQIVEDSNNPAPNMATYHARRAFVESVFNKTNSKILGVNDIDWIKEHFNDPLYTGIPVGYVIGAIEFDPSTVGLKVTKEGDPDHHTSYPVAVVGDVKNVHLFTQAVDVRSIIGGWTPKSEVANPTPLRERRRVQAWKAAEGGMPLYRQTAPQPVPRSRIIDSTIIDKIDTTSEVQRVDIPVDTSEIIGVLEGLNDSGHNTLVVGGAARDALLGLNPKDIDVEVYGISIDQLSKELSKHGKVDAVGKSFGVLKFKPHNGELDYDFSVPRTESKVGKGHTGFKVELSDLDTREASLRRDFTINSMGYNPVTKVLYDHHKGIQDMKDGVLRHVSDKFAEDPLRVLRAMQFQARFDLDIAPETYDLMRSMVDRGDMNNLPKERLYEEWKKWSEKGVAHGRIFDFLRRTGIGETMYPSIMRLKDTPQDPRWHPEGDVEEHTSQVMRKAIDIAERDGLDPEQRGHLIMSALLHDIAKPQTTETRVINGQERITAIGHEAAGVPIAEDILSSMGYPQKFIDSVTPLVREHLAHATIHNIQGFAGKQKAYNKLIRRLGKGDIDQLLRLMEADMQGRNNFDLEPPESLFEMYHLKEVVGTKFEPILKGRDLIARGLSPGTEFGQILSIAASAQEGGAFNTPQGAATWLTARLNAGDIPTRVVRSTRQGEINLDLKEDGLWHNRVTGGVISNQDVVEKLNNNEKVPLKRGENRMATLNGEVVERPVEEYTTPEPSSSQVTGMPPGYQPAEGPKRVDSPVEMDENIEEIAVQDDIVTRSRLTEEQRQDIAEEMSRIRLAAEADGTFMKAPNGEPSNLDEKQWLQVRTKWFKKWFGDWENNPRGASKVVDENGEPEVVYHGTTATFNQFREGNRSYGSGDTNLYLGDGFYFTNDYDVANSYSDETDNVLEVFLNIRNPYISKKWEHTAPSMQGSFAKDIGVPVGNETTFLKSKGHDGVISSDTESDYTEMLVYNPNQIKSATENTGEFSPSSPLFRSRITDGTVEPIYPDNVNTEQNEKDNATRYRNRTRWDSSRGEKTLRGAPKIKTRKNVTGADPELTYWAEEYARRHGIDYRRQKEYVRVDTERAQRIAEAYEEMEHNPQDPAVKEAFQNLIAQTTAQYNVLAEAGYTFYFFDETNDPYAGSPWAAMEDLRNNKTMAVYATEAGYGSGAPDINADEYPMLADTGIEWGYGKPDGPKKRVLANDLFRAVHDAFGHGLEGSGFRARGEENAWQSHARLFTGSARAAITSETRGQNSWLNFNPRPYRDIVGDEVAKQRHPDNWETITVGEHNTTASVEDTIFADQKTGLMPEWTWTEGFDEGRPTTRSRLIEEQNIRSLEEEIRQAAPELAREGVTAKQVFNEIRGDLPLETVQRILESVGLDRVDGPAALLSEDSPKLATANNIGTIARALRKGRESTVTIDGKKVRVAKDSKGVWRAVDRGGNPTGQSLSRTQITEANQNSSNLFEESDIDKLIELGLITKKDC